MFDSCRQSIQFLKFVLYVQFQFNVQFLKRECSICLTIEHHAALYFYLTSTNWPGLVTDNPLSETDGWPNLTNESSSVHQEVRQPTFTTRPNFMENRSIWSHISLTSDWALWPAVLYIIYLRSLTRYMTFKSNLVSDIFLSDKLGLRVFSRLKVLQIVFIGVYESSPEILQSW